MTSYISAELRLLVRQDAGDRCGYCLCSEKLTGFPLEAEHIVPESGGGETLRENLWLACHRCNKFKGNRVQAVDPITGQATHLFNPRTQHWGAHFEWSMDGSQILGLTRGASHRRVITNE